MMQHDAPLYFFSKSTSAVQLHLLNPPPPSDFLTIFLSILCFFKSFHTFPISLSCVSGFTPTLPHDLTSTDISLSHFFLSILSPYCSLSFCPSISTLNYLVWTASGSLTQCVRVLTCVCLWLLWARCTGFLSF